MLWIKRLAVLLAGLLVFVVVAGWLFLSSALFSGPRSNLVENILEKQLGQDVQINGDVRVVPGRFLKVSAEGLSLPSQSMPDITLAEIAAIHFDMPLSDLWAGHVEISNLSVTGTSANLIVDETGTASWKSGDGTKPPKAPKSEKPKKSTPLAQIFTDRTLRLGDTQVIYKNAINGLDLDLTLTEIALDRGDGTSPRTLSGSGTLNDAAMTLTGTFPKDAPFQATLAFEHIDINLDGTPAEGGYDAGFQVAMMAQIAELGQFLDVVKLERAIEGTAHVGAVLKHGDGVTRIDGLDVLATLDTGQSVVVTGNMGELGSKADVSLVTRIRLYPEDNEPAPTKKRADLKLVSVDMVIDSVPGQTPQRSMVIETNGFTLDTAGEGPPPISVSQLSRTPEGKLRLGNLNLRIGPPSEPFIILDGIVEDALNLQGISAEGQIAFPADALLKPEGFKGGKSLGEFSGDFHLNGNIQRLSLSNLDAKTSGTDLWDLEVHGTVENVLRFEDVNLDIAVDVPSGADLLTAMSLNPVQTGHTELSANLRSQGNDWGAEAHIGIGPSELSLKIDLDDLTTTPVVNGSIESDMIQLDHLRQIIAASIELRKIDEAPAPETASPLKDVTLMPLGRAVLLSGVDLDVDLDLRHIEGAKGVSSIQSELTLKEKQLAAGPLKFEYGGAHFDVSGAMDLNDEAHILNLKGKAGGWQMHELLEALKFKKGASGTLYADFDVSGPTSSVKDFINAISGNAMVSMNKGSIETQLLDLAGLGVLPWLFSSHKQKVAPIVCLRAPIYLSNGNISTKRTVVETDQVQIVAFGDVSLPAKSINMNVQPRKIGEPLKRSPWPFTASGSLTKPKIKVKDGPKKLKRSDGANKMPAKRKLCVPDILQLQ
ncbi:AsmA family protein [Shimia thalassica]|uniref:AsmA family protein n=1 Tax=Shimia thalassica TaxID=1715693 RepID=UPI002495242A|nr:AsmA family protein [Shimia thalassica]